MALNRGLSMLLKKVRVFSSKPVFMNKLLMKSVRTVFILLLYLSQQKKKHLLNETRDKQNLFGIDRS